MGIPVFGCARVPIDLRPRPGFNRFSTSATVNAGKSKRSTRVSTRFHYFAFVWLAASSFIVATGKSQTRALQSVNARSDAGATPARASVHFETDVLPIFQAQCVQCHGATVSTKTLNLSTYEGAMKGGESGVVIVPGKPGESRLYKLIQEGKMPFGGKPLPDPQVGIIRAWIEAGAPSSSKTPAMADEALTQHDVLPILFLRCTICHGSRRQEGGLDLHTREAMLKGGHSGPAIIAGRPDESLLIKKIRAGEMAPKKRLREVSIRPITTMETEKLARWIAQRAPEGNLKPDVAGNGPDQLVSEKDRQFWSFQSPRRPPEPRVKQSDRVKNAIDAFVLGKLEENGLTLSPEADKLTLIRRAYFDLTGLPPTPEEVQAFLADRDVHAYEKLIDGLLASPRYGERWGRYWLDLAGYSDSEGKQALDFVRPVAYRYRDYVIRSFNADKPYDRFLVEQIAGDELEDYEHAPAVTGQMMDNLIATGFLRMAPDSTLDPDAAYVEERLDAVSDEIDVLSSGVMGLTMRCAKCHSHKYDPIPQRDYYRLVAVFKGAYDYYDWLVPEYLKDQGGIKSEDRHLPYIEPGKTPWQLLEQQKERETRNGELDLEIERLKAALEQKAEPIRKKILDQRLSQLPKTLSEDLRKTVDTRPEQHTELQKYLAEKFAAQLKIESQDLTSADPDYRREALAAQTQILLLESQKEPEAKIRALWDRGDPTPTYILRRGDPTNVGTLVGPGVPSVLTDGRTALAVNPPWPGAPKTGRRLAFAQWLTRPDNPLTARVMVNQIWAHHFGQGIVKTPGNFGHTGAAPTHPEMLDWLATEFVRQGWSMKAMHRLMMTSSTYRQSSQLTPTLEKADPENRLLSRMPMKRMEAELLYDTLVYVSGRFDETRYGPPEPVLVREDGLVTPVETKKGWRRSIYVRQRRTEMPTILETFDLPSMSPNCLDRMRSTVALQALYMVNDTMVRKLAGYFAERVEREVGKDPQKQIERAYWMAMGRPPMDEERKIGLDVLNRLIQAEEMKPSAKAVAEAPPARRIRPEADTAGGDLKRDSNFQALRKFCQGLFDSAAFLYID